MPTFEMGSSQKMFLSIVSVIFAAIAVLHFLRLSLGWDAVIGGWLIPAWFSGLAVLAGIYLSYTGFRLRRKIKSGDDKK